MARKIQFFNPSNAEKAFVYQQTQELVSSLKNVGPVSVLLEKYANDPSCKNYAVTFILGSLPVKIQARSEGDDLMEVCMSAKNQIKKKLSMLSQSMERSPQRDKLIEELKKFPYIQ